MLMQQPLELSFPSAIVMGCQQSFTPHSDRKSRIQSACNKYLTRGSDKKYIFFALKSLKFSDFVAQGPLTHPDW